ncbi:MAG: ABC transporter ATP-binding protein [Lachnospiraceae bacterium]|nr:ABC transporter ATP-binding protein [Lachnospiraceae bacterium]
MSNVLELKEVTKNYGDFKLDQVSFVVPEGCICGFIGQNGAGKTTTIQLILDSIRRDGGDITVFGRDIRKEGPALKEDIGVVFDEMGFHDFMTPNDINRMMKYVYDNWDEEAFWGYLKRFSLPRKKKCGAFSRGMQMKLQIAAAMSHHAKLLLMDEPTSGLDPIVRNEILQIFQEFVMEEDHTVFLSSHITGDIERIADMVVFIDHGQIVLQGNKDEILERHGLLKCKKAEFERMEAKDVVSSRQSAFGVEVLVKDREECRQKYPDMTVEQTSLEEIMIFYVNDRFVMNGAKQGE